MLYPLRSAGGIAILAMAVVVLTGCPKKQPPPGPTPEELAAERARREAEEARRREEAWGNDLRSRENQAQQACRNIVVNAGLREARAEGLNSAMSSRFIAGLKPLDEIPDLSSIESYCRSEVRKWVIEAVAERIHFDFDKSELKPEALEVLARKANLLRANPDLRVELQGHCDERGTNEYNLGLGERRSRAAYDYLVKAGISADRLKTISYGEERPLCTERGEPCWGRNRRDEFVVLNP